MMTTTYLFGVFVGLIVGIYLGRKGRRRRSHQEKIDDKYYEHKKRWGR